MALIQNDITQAGINLIAKGQAGATIHFTKIVMGEGYLADGQSIRTLKNVIKPILNLEIGKVKVLEGGKAVIGGAFNNSQVQTGFYYRELGLYAEDPDIGEILYCYGNAGNAAEWIPPSGGSSVIEKIIDIITIVGSTQNVTAVLSSEIYASKADLAEVEAIALGVQAELEGLKPVVIEMNDKIGKPTDTEATATVFGRLKEILNKIVVGVADLISGIDTKIGKSTDTDTTPTIFGRLKEIFNKIMTGVLPAVTGVSNKIGESTDTETKPTIFGKIDKMLKLFKPKGFTSKRETINITFNETGKDQKIFELNGVGKVRLIQIISTPSNTGGNLRMVIDGQVFNSRFDYWGGVITPNGMETDFAPSHGNTDSIYAHYAPQFSCVKKIEFFVNATYLSGSGMVMKCKIDYDVLVDLE